MTTHIEGNHQAKPHALIAIWFEPMLNIPFLTTFRFKVGHVHTIAGGNWTTITVNWTKNAFACVGFRVTPCLWFWFRIFSHSLTRVTNITDRTLCNAKMAPIYNTPIENRYSSLNQKQSIFLVIGVVLT